MLFLIGKQNLFIKNIEHLKLNYSNKEQWEGDYEFYILDIITPAFVQDGLLENKKLNLTAKVNRSYSSVNQWIGYMYGKNISAKMSQSISDSDEKHYVAYDLKGKFQNLYYFQKKYKTIKIDLQADYKSDWPISGSVGKTDYFKYSTKDLTDKDSSSWIDIINVSEKWYSMKIGVEVSYKVYFQDNRPLAIPTWLFKTTPVIYI